MADNSLAGMGPNRENKKQTSAAESSFIPHFEHFPLLGVNLVHQDCLFFRICFQT